jgi:tetratricopeptide (TPR) repeat protein
MNIDNMIQQVLSEPIDNLMLPDSLSDGDVEAIVQRLKDEADRHWYIDPKESLQYAEKIISIGQEYNNLSHIALGTMAKGDARHYMSEYDAAWSLLCQSGELFLEISDEVGWARTCIGKLAMCIQVDNIEQAKSDANVALKIFLDHQDYDKYARLINNIAHVSIHQSEYEYVIGLYEQISKNQNLFLSIPPTILVILYNNVGYSYFQIGEMQYAKHYYELGLAIYIRQKYVLGIAIIESNIAFVDLYQGRFRQALTSFHNTTTILEHKSLGHYVETLVGTALCYARLNRFDNLYQVCTEALELARNINHKQEVARLLMLLGIAYSHFGRFSQALSAFNESAQIYNQLDSNKWEAYTFLLIAQVEYMQGDMQSTQENLNCFYEKATLGADLQSCEGRLLQARVYMTQGNYVEALSFSQVALNHAKEHKLLIIRYEAHLLIGKIYEIVESTRKAFFHFLAATLATDKMQHQLTLALRSSLVDDKINAFHHIIMHYLIDDKIDAAFFHLQRIKTQVWLGFLTNLDDVNIGEMNENSTKISDRINTLRGEHHWLYQKIKAVPRK